MGKTYLLGFGIYQGVDLQPEDLFPGVEARRQEVMAELGLPSKIEDLSKDQRDMFIKLVGNPKILLDNGKVVWGAECWWGPEAEFKKRFAKETIINADIDEMRCAAKHKLEANQKMFQLMKEEVMGVGDGSRTLVINPTW
jgi:hypothetical protein